MSPKKNMPELFEELIQKGFLAQSNIHSTDDGFYAADHRLAQLGDGYLYAVPVRGDYIYGMFTMSDQKAIKPGIIVSFAAVDPQTMQPSTLSNKAIKAYFRHPQAQGAYLLARLYVNYIAQERHIQLPRYYEEVYHGGNYRLPRFVEINNEDAVHTVCDQQTLYIRDLENVSEFEKLAILATHTGCTSFHSFAAGVQYCARAFGKDMQAQLCADTQAQPYHNADSKWVKKQKKHHKDV